MKKIENATLVAVEYTDDHKKVTLTFLDKEALTVHGVNFNRQSYDQTQGKFVDDDEKAAKVDGWCEEYFGDTFDNLANHIGEPHTIYCYERFSSLFECDVIEKFDASQKGKMFQTEISDIKVEQFFIKIRYIIDGKTYESKQTLGQYIDSMQQWFDDPIRRAKEYEKFQQKFGVPVSEAETLIGNKIIVEVKLAFGKFAYGDIKPFA